MPQPPRPLQLLFCHGFVVLVRYRTLFISAGATTATTSTVLSTRKTAALRARATLTRSAAEFSHSACTESKTSSIQLATEVESPNIYEVYGVYELRNVFGYYVFCFVTLCAFRYTFSLLIQNSSKDLEVGSYPDTAQRTANS